MFKKLIITTLVGVLSCQSSFGCDTVRGFFGTARMCARVFSPAAGAIAGGVVVGYALSPQELPTRGEKGAPGRKNFASIIGSASPEELKALRTEDGFEDAINTLSEDVRGKFAINGRTPFRYEGYTSPLLKAIEERDQAKAAALVAAGASVNQQDPEGKTPLIFAALTQRSPEMVGALVRLGAKPSGAVSEGLNRAYAESLVTGEVPGCFDGLSLAKFTKIARELK